MNLNQITVPALGVAEAIIFYKTLGLKLIVESLPHYARFVCPDGHSTFSIHQTEQLAEGEGIYVYFECKNLDKQVDKLKQKGLKFDLEPTDQRWLWREARLKDPFNNQIILYYAGENRINPPWRIS
jgi:catechol 2,3-dioxygenase-like lactoylglutathione lyase family enzyme